MKNNMGVTYYIKNKINNKYYIGIDSTNYQRRWKDHIWWAQKCKEGKVKESQLVDRKIAEYGLKNFEYKEIYFSDNFEELKIKEKEFIHQYDSFISNGKGYNLTLGGEGCTGLKFSEKSKRKMSKSKKGKLNPNFGKPRSLETIQKIKLSNKGKKRSEETRRKIYIANIGKKLTLSTRIKMSASRKGKNNPFYGKHHSDKAKEKIRKANIGENSPHFKYKINKEELFNYYIIQNNTLKKTATFFGCSTDTLITRLREYNCLKSEINV